MDAYEATKIVFQRIQNLDPENASKIMGFLLIQDHGDKEMIRLAFGPETSLHSVILKAKKDLNLASPNTPSTPSSPSLFNNNPLPFSRQNSSSSASSRLINGGGGVVINIPSPLSITTTTTTTTFTDDFAYNDPFYVNNGGGEVDLIDELQLQDQLSFLNDGSDTVLYPSLPHRRSCSVSDICLYYAKGYCKNGTSCRFLHGHSGGGGGGGGAMVAEESGAILGSPNFPCSHLPTNKCLDFFMQQQIQADSPRSRLERGDFGMNFVNPGSRQIYLTFPCESSFREEDVSNYFSIFGPVQDVRIPYQQKRMFGFVTFDFPETVKLILAKGNPHFVCDARVLVKPYKEKGKIPDKHRRQQQQMERGEFAGCGSPTGLDSRDPYDLQLGAKMFYNSQDMLWRRKLEEQVDLQQAIELQNRRLMSLKLLDVKRNHHHHHHRALSTGSVISSPTYSPTFFNQNSVFTSNRSSSPEAKQEIGLIGEVENPATAASEDVVIEKDKVKDDYVNGKKSPQRENDFRESLEHNLPDSPFASPKALGDYTTAFTNGSWEAEKRVNDSQTSSTNNNLISGSSLFLPSSCYFQVPRFPSGHETIGMM
ncbi:hypothetical protein ACJIZ3_016046 [Penstemon smallii]|uniref:Uncharacterized protein n=1 Tax=Penstemon smallii TaxID=265156 RepID=A0ABD3RPE9_9LAMI